MRDIAHVKKMHPHNFIDLTGQVFGLWTAINLSDRVIDGGACWDCVCKCGTRRSVKGHDLRSGRSASCGCVRKTSPWSTSDPQYATKMCRRLRAANPEKYKAIVRQSGYRKRYNLEFEQVEEMLANQDGKCAICQRDIQLGGRSGAKVDHDHSTGYVRGVLCSTCNTGLGSFYDNVNSLAAAIGYLDRANRERLKVA